MKILSIQLLARHCKDALGACLFKNTSLSLPVTYAIFWSRLLEKAQHLKKIRNQFITA